MLMSRVCAGVPLPFGACQWFSKNWTRKKYCRCSAILLDVRSGQSCEFAQKSENGNIDVFHESNTATESLALGKLIPQKIMKIAQVFANTAKSSPAATCGRLVADNSRLIICNKSLLSATSRRALSATFFHYLQPQNLYLGTLLQQLENVAGNSKMLQIIGLQHFCNTECLQLQHVADWLDKFLWRRCNQLANTRTHTRAITRPAPDKKWKNILCWTNTKNAERKLIIDARWYSR